jgi:hypothetical protein
MFDESGAAAVLFFPIKIVDIAEIEHFTIKYGVFTLFLFEYAIFTL